MHKCKHACTDTLVIYLCGVRHGLAVQVCGDLEDVLGNQYQLQVNQARLHVTENVMTLHAQHTAPPKHAFRLLTVLSCSIISLSDSDFDRCAYIL